MSREQLKWLDNISQNVFNFVSEMQDDDFSYVRYSFSGDLYTKDDNWGLANLVYATKALDITGNLDKLSQLQKDNLAKSMLGFTKEDGFIYDPILSNPDFKTFLKSFISPARRHRFKTSRENTRRGETKQVFAALNHLGKKPLSPLSDVPHNNEELIAYLDNYNWSTPWHSCAHFAILMFFLKFNDYFFDKNDNDELIKSAVTYMDKMQSAEDGCWYKGNVPLYEKVNGAMKYFTGLHAAGIYDFKYPEKIVDTALSAINDEHACNNFNVVYCLYATYKLIPDYRKDDVEKFLLDRLGIYKEFYFKDLGGFSFKKGKANDVLYYGKVSKGLKEPDIHGTSLYVFGIALIDEILGLGLGFKVPIT